MLGEIAGLRAWGMEELPTNLLTKWRFIKEGVGMETKASLRSGVGRAAASKPAARSLQQPAVTAWGPGAAAVSVAPTVAVSLLQGLYSN
jgi:hypothetical protein